MQSLGYKQLLQFYLIDFILFYFIENGEHFLLYLSLNLYHQNVITHHSCKGNFHDQPI